MTAPALKFLFTLRLKVGDVVDLGRVGGIGRRDAPLIGGQFEGPELSGVVLPGGADRISLREDGAVLLDVRTDLETTDGERVGVTYRGIRFGTPEVAARWEQGEEVASTDYYMRIALRFETAAPRLDWLNRIIAVGTGRRTEVGPVYQVFVVE